MQRISHTYILGPSQYEVQHLWCWKDRLRMSLAEIHGLVKFWRDGNINDSMMFLSRVTPSGLGGHSVGCMGTWKGKRAWGKFEGIFSHFPSSITLRGCHTSAQSLHATWISSIKNQVGWTRCQHIRRLLVASMMIMWAAVSTSRSWVASMMPFHGKKEGAGTNGVPHRHQTQMRGSAKKLKKAAPPEIFSLSFTKPAYKSH